VRIFNTLQIIANHLAQEIERRQAQEALKQERERLFSVLDILPAFVYLQKQDYTIGFANRSFRELFGDPGNRPCYEVTHNRQTPCDICPTFRVFDTKSPEIWEWCHKTGQMYMIYDDIFTDTDGTEMVVEFGIEITELKQAQEALRKSRDHLEEEVRTRTAELTEANRHLKQEMEEREYVQAALQEKQAQLIHSGRLASLGEMASGVAHELNQPLSIIRLYAESLKFSLKKAEPLEFKFQDKIDSIIRSVDRAADIIEHMRGYARANHSDYEKICLSKPIEDALIFFREQFRNHKITLETNYETDLPKVSLDSQRFEQIAVNLLSNARYAADKRGELEKGFQKKVALRLFYDKYKNSIVFEIEDNGIGMDGKEKERCQEPFFTTKEVGEGTGLGLSIISGLVKEFKGTLEIESEKGIGTTMRVRVPVEN
jgi:C4-dicarboxylate-specific signal transduction histidine kinase